MLSRFIANRSHLRLLTLISSQSKFSNYRHYSCPSSSLHHPVVPNPSLFSSILPRHFSSNGGSSNNDGDSKNQSHLWNFSSENDENIESVFGSDDIGGSLEGIGEIASVSKEKNNNDGDSKNQSGLWNLSSENDQNIVSVFGSDDNGGSLEEIGEMASVSEEKDWVIESEEKDDIFKEVEEVGKGGTGTIGGAIEGGFEDWTSTPGNEETVFDFEKGGEELEGLGAGDEIVESQKMEEEERLEAQRKREEEERLETEEKELSAVLKGPDRAFGDLIAASGITDAMLDSLIALKDLDDIEGLPSLHEIEKMRYEKNSRKSSRAEIERQKQEEISNARVRQVDSKGRAYGTGKRKCSIARVWIQPGEGKFVVNDKQFDVYFPMLDHRATLLRPFTETKTLGLMDVSCTVKGGGVSGQVGAIRLGISRALQNWAPDEHRPPLKAVGFLTRDSRIVERKKPGKAKARKSFQWVKR